MTNNPSDTLLDEALRPACENAAKEMWATDGPSCLSESKIADIIEQEFTPVVEALRRAFREHDKERDALVLALHNVMEHVYAQNDYTTRDYEKYYAAVDAALVALAPYRNPKNGELLASKTKRR